MCGTTSEIGTPNLAHPEGVLCLPLSPCPGGTACAKKACSICHSGTTGLPSCLFIKQCPLAQKSYWVEIIGFLIYGSFKHTDCTKLFSMVWLGLPWMPHFSPASQPGLSLGYLWVCCPSHSGFTMVPACSVQGLRC